MMHFSGFKNVIWASMILALCINESNANPSTKDNGSCPSINDLNSACIQINNTGDTDIQMRAVAPWESAFRTATSGKNAHYEFLKPINGKELFILKPSVTSQQTDASCAAYDWAVSLSNGKEARIDKLAFKIYRYSYGYKKNNVTGKYTMVNCSES
jgi:hypothetical protein